MAKGCSTLEAPNVSDDDDYSSEEELQTMVFILGQDCSELDSAMNMLSSKSYGFVPFGRHGDV